MELNVVKFFNKLGGRILDPAANFISYIPLLAAFWASIALAILIFDKRNGSAIFIALAIASLLHFVVTEGIFKILLPRFMPVRQRPYLAHPQMIKARGHAHKDSSFPSSHMSTAAAILTVLVFFYPVIWPAALLFAAFTAFARLHNGMHYPSDVVAGAVLGILYGAVAIYLVG